MWLWLHLLKKSLVENFIFCAVIPEFLDYLISSEKMLMLAELIGCVTWFTYFLDLLYGRYKCAKFQHCRICVTDLREGDLFILSRKQPRKGSFWIGLNTTEKIFSCDIRSINSQKVCNRRNITTSNENKIKFRQCSSTNHQFFKILEKSPLSLQKIVSYRSSCLVTSNVVQINLGFINSQHFTTFETSSIDHHPMHVCISLRISNIHPQCHLQAQPWPVALSF